MALSKGRGQIDIVDILRECYGDGDNTVLHSVLNSALDQVHREVEATMLDHFQSYQVRDKLQRLDAALQELEWDEIQLQQRNAQEKIQTERKLREMEIPVGVTAQDLVQYRTYQHIVEQIQDLEEEIAVAETAVTNLEQEEQREISIAAQHLQGIHEASQQLEKTADLCAMMS